MKLAYYCDGLHIVIDECSDKMAMSELLQCFAMDLGNEHEPVLNLDSKEDAWSFLLERGFLTDSYYVVTDEVANLLGCLEQLKDRNNDDYKNVISHYFKTFPDKRVDKATTKWLAANALPKNKLLVVTWNEVISANESINDGQRLDNALIGAGGPKGDFRWVSCTADELTSAYVSRQTVDMRKYRDLAIKCKAELKF